MVRGHPEISRASKGHRAVRGSACGCYQTFQHLWSLCPCLLATFGAAPPSLPLNEAKTLHRLLHLPRNAKLLRRFGGGMSTGRRRFCPSHRWLELWRHGRLTPPLDLSRVSEMGLLRLQKKVIWWSGPRASCRHLFGWETNAWKT